MEQRNITITKIKLVGYEPGVPSNELNCSVEIGFTEKILDPDFMPDEEDDDQEQVLHLLESNIKFKNFYLHADFLEAMQRLRPHLPWIFEYTSRAQQQKLLKTTVHMDWIDRPDDFCAPFHITGLIITGSEENPAVVLNGYMIGELGVKQLLNTTAQRYEGFGSSSYIFHAELYQALEEVLAEARAVVLNGKQKPAFQLEFDFDQPAAAPQVPEGLRVKAK